MQVASAQASRPATRSVAEPATVAQYLARAKELRAIYSGPVSDWPRPTIDAGVEYREIGKLSPTPEFPAENPFTKEKEALGRALFFDPRLSGSGQIACASCHDPDLAWADGRTVSFGHSRTALKRNAPSILFSAYQKSLFWDGRAASLEEQFNGPVIAHDEMNGDPQTIEARLDAVPEYREQFKQVFGADHVTLANAAKAVATFERGVSKLAGRSDFDRFMSGKANALSDAAVRGLHVFRTSGRCMNCHSGPLFTDGQFHDLGFSFYGRKLQDLGRYEVTKEAKDVGRFRTPSLRDVGRTRPYMHNGLLELPGVIAAYNAGMVSLTRSKDQKDDPLFPTKDKLLKPLGLGSLERDDLKEFLLSLDEPLLRVRPPALPPDLAKGGVKPASTEQQEN